MPTIRVRMPPSPTGLMHIGTARTALFNYLFAKKLGGTFVFRIEDTDRERSKPEYEKDILDMFAWLGLSYDEFYRQSERTDIHKKALQKLIDSGHAYISKEEATKDEDGKPLRGEVIRFKNPNTTITFTDLVRGEVTFDTTELKDFVIAKSLEEPLYHLAVVVDDIDMGITHVIRGEDHISNTPRQILIIEALGSTRPSYAHLPLVLAPDRSKLSKRKHGEIVSVSHYKSLGYLPEAMVNFFAFLGWNPGTDQEIFSLSELIDSFDLSKVQKGGAILNGEKLDWINAQYIKGLTDTNFVIHARQFLSATYENRDITAIIPVLKERLVKFSDLKDMEAAGDIEYFFTEPVYDPAALVWKKGTPEKTKMHLAEVEKIIATMPERFSAEEAKAALWPYAETNGKGEVLWPLRVALSGKEKSPDPFTLASVLGRETTLRHVKSAHEKIA